MPWWFFTFCEYKLGPRNLVLCLPREIYRPIGLGNHNAFDVFLAMERQEKSIIVARTIPA